MPEGPPQVELFSMHSEGARLQLGIQCKQNWGIIHFGSCLVINHPVHYSNHVLCAIKDKEDTMRNHDQQLSIAACLLPVVYEVLGKDLMPASATLETFSIMFIRHAHALILFTQDILCLRHQRESGHRVSDTVGSGSYHCALGNFAGVEDTAVA